VINYYEIALNSMHAKIKNEEVYSKYMIRIEMSMMKHGLTCVAFCRKMLIHNYNSNISEEQASWYRRRVRWVSWYWDV